VVQRFHVSSTDNRESIKAHGLDWTLMGVAPGIAGSPHPEREGCFLARDETETEWFVGMNNTGGPVDVWAVELADDVVLVDAGDGYDYYPDKIPPEQLELVRSDIPPAF
jgi:hypothetical protein